MGKDPSVGVPPSFPRFILWEILGIVGILHILQFSHVNDSTALFFLGNSIVFVALYPVLYFYNQLKLPLVLKFLILPLHYALRTVLMVSSFLWVAYVLYISDFMLGGVNCYLVFKNYWMFLAPFFVMDYFWLLEHLWGLSRVNFTFWSSLGMLSDSVSGIVGGFYLGRTLNTKWGTFFGDTDIQTLIWIIFVLIGIAAVVWFGNKTRKG